MIDGERHVDAGGPERPELAVEAGLAGDLVAIDREDDVAGLEFGARRRSLAGDADHHEAVVDLGRVHAEPRPRRLVDAAELAQIVEHRFQQVDRHDHVDVLGLAVALAFELQRADADQLAAVRDQSGAAPIGMRGMGEDRLVQQIFPIAGEFLLGRDLARDRPRASAGAADHDAVADLVRRRTSRAAADRCRARPSACTRPKPDLEIEAERMALHDAAVAEMQPDGFGLGDEIADGQHQPVVDQHAIAGALGAERLRAEGVGRDDRMQPDHRGQRAVEIETVIARARLVRRRHFPFGQRGHRCSPGIARPPPTPRNPNRSRFCQRQFCRVISAKWPRIEIADLTQDWKQSQFRHSR